MILLRGEAMTFPYILVSIINSSVVALKYFMENRESSPPFHPLLFSVCPKAGIIRSK